MNTTTINFPHEMKGEVQQSKSLYTIISFGNNMERGLETFFEGFLRKGSVFFDKRTLQTPYIPETVNHREDQIKQMANILAPVLKGDKPSNIFIYGKTGTGKTLT